MGLALAAVLLVSASAGAADPAVAAPEMKLERVVLFMRHGIRPQTRSPVLPAGWAADPWPAWSVPDGTLTPHGAKALELMGRYDRESYARRGLLAAGGCPGAGEVYVWADAEERVFKSAEAEVRGMFPGCSVAVHSVASKEEDADPIFSPLDGHRPIDAELAREAVFAEGNPARLARKHAAALDVLQKALGCCAPPLCAQAGLPAGCRMADLPTKVASEPNRRPKLSGMWDVASTASQVIMLEYSEGMPMSQVGWGRVSKRDIEALMAGHTGKGEVVQRPFYIATRGASPLLKRMVEGLEARNGTGSRLTLLVGHDTNLTDLGGMLNFHWRMPGYPADYPLPDGGVGFELLRAPDGMQYVRPFYRAQTMDQMRELTPLSPRRPAFLQYLSIPGCSTGKDTTMCPLDQFKRLVASKSVPDTPLAP
jgi:4-phytase/acid phosphatase